jgi:hypothetical protein
MRRSIEIEQESATAQREGEVKKISEDGAGAAAQKARVFVVFGVELRIEHLDEALDGIAVRQRRFR